MTPTLMVVIAVLLGLLTIGLGAFFIGRSKDNAEAQKFNEMIRIAAKDDATEVPVDKNGLEILLRNVSTVSANTNREVIYKALFLAKPTDGTDVDSHIAQFCTTGEIIPDVRIALLSRVLKPRKNPSIIGTLLNYARSTDDRMAGIAAIEATRFSSGDAQFQQFLDIINSTKDDMIRKAAEENAAEIIKNAASKPVLGDAVSKAHDSATDAVVKYSMLRLLGRIGGEKALGIARKNLASKDIKDQIAAIVALGTWADDSGFKELITFLGTGPDLATRSRAYESAYQYAYDKESNYKELWTLLSTEAKTEDEQMKLIRGLVNVKPVPWSFAILEKLAKDSDYGKVIDLAERGIVRLKDIQKTQGTPKDK